MSRQSLHGPSCIPFVFMNAKYPFYRVIALRGMKKKACDILYSWVEGKNKKMTCDSFVLSYFN